MRKSFKKLFFIVATVLIVASLSFTLVACDKTDKKWQSMQESISYANTDLLVAEDADFYVEVAVGNREKALIADGEVGEQMPYCTLSISPLQFDMVDKTMSYKLKGDKGEYVGECQKNIIGINHIAHIDNLDKVGNLASVTLTVGDKSFEYVLQSVISKGINYLKAVESIYQNCTEELQSMFDGNKFTSEIYVKVSCDRQKNPKKYYWFVNVIENSDNMLCVLVDMETGEIVAKKNR